ncbi:hypothetical protein L9F63_002899, partial [Diploptera punctata]
MERTDPQGPPGDVENDDGITGTALSTNHTEPELDWSPVTSSQLESSVRKVAASTSRLLFLTVEYVEEPTGEFGRSAFSSFEPGAPFSPQPSSSLSEFEHRVSPLDPNMSSAARYSPVYAITGTNSSALAVVTGEAPSAGGTSTSSNPSSPFPSSQVASPIINSSPANALPPSPSSANPYIDTTQSHAASVGHSFVNPTSPLHILPDTPTSTADGLLRQVVTGSTFFRTAAASSASAGILGATPPHSPLQPPLTPTDNYVVSSSTGPLVDSVPVTSADFTSSSDVAVAVAVTTSPGESGLHQRAYDPATNSSDGNDISKFVKSTPDGNVIEGDSNEYPLVGGTTDETEHYHSISGTIKTEGALTQARLVMWNKLNFMTSFTKQSNEFQLNLPCLVIEEDHATLPMDVTLNVTTEQQRDLIEAELLGTQVNGAIESQVRRLECKVDTKSFWCEECCNSYDSGCPQHRVQTICDKPVPSRAWATLPASYLAINKVGTSSSGCPVYGVFARKTIPKRTQFGPIEGVLVKADDSQHDIHVISCGQETQLELLVESETGSMLKLDTTCENSSNWMRFVRSAETLKEQNLILSQQGHSLYFTTTRVIHPRQELQVWYSLPYANKRGLSLLQSDTTEKRAIEEIERWWPCFECNEKFLSSEELQKHLNIHDSERGEDGDLVKTKKKSGRTFRRKSLSHFSHKKYKSDSEKRGESHPYQCHTCHRVFPRNYSLKRHLLLHIAEKKYKCDHCGHQFSHIHNRDRHIRKHHKNHINDNSMKLSMNSVLKKKPSGLVNNEWLCSHCSLTFTSASVLNLHTLAHAADNLEESETITGLPSDFHSCPQCTQEFPSKKELIEHVSAHGKLTPPQLRTRLRSVNPAKPWKCELCYKSFATEDRLQRHMLVHGAEESKPLQCDICYKRFLNNSALACHIKIHTDEKKIFECPICKAVFDQVLALKEHVHIHSENGLFTCPQCNKVFQVFDEYSLIRKHIRAFHSDRKHTCSYCSKLFPTLDKLRMHMLSFFSR